ncbi:ricin-type beta-trefoil lectin domain protein [Streptomyces roseirectus]|uniref:Ricin-type beta-trefoil lectin domain protein n=1 Tax=Streptomyces roseirectus TaxID=2768066 RepID=A0A7H0IMG7_9ACTN|nr:RICIN domain-containing protein [Streptomyces roseirectus]QNP73983.1 ricin-type beta-trefoil lectin domain protein [Streptomyces roseirectus]
MQSPNPPRPPYPPRPGWHPGDSDRHLAAQFTAPGGDASRAVALLLARHWRAAHDYAEICLAARGESAQLVAAAAFHRVLGRLAGGRSGGALRPQLLVAVRDIVREWAGADAVPDALPELGKTIGGRGLRVARTGTPERRRLAERAFRTLPAASQCLLWHAEAEAEPISIPAGLLGVDELTATAGLREARTQFRAGCVRAHRELAPSDECRFYNRLLDVPLRRGGTLLPDVRDHLAACRHCRHAAEQLSFFDDALDILLVETVLGWGGRRYLESRPGRGGAHRPVAGPVPGGRHRSARIVDLAGRRAKAALIGAGVTSLVVLASVLVGQGLTGGDGVPASRATWGAPVGGPDFPAESDGSRPSVSASGAASPASVEQQPAGVAHGRLFAPSVGLCLDSEGGHAVEGARAVLAGCSGAASQQWSYQADGLLRSVATPTLCLAADADGHQGSAVLAGCVVHSGEVFFDLTVRGELLLRRGGGLVVAPGESREGMGVVVTERDGSAGQRWVFDSSSAGSDAGSGAGAGSGSVGGRVVPGPSGGDAPDALRPQAGPERKGAGESQGSEGDPAAPGAATPPPAGTPDAPAEPRYHTRIAQVGAPGGEQAPASEPEPVPVSEPVGQVVATLEKPVRRVTERVSGVVGGLGLGAPGV